MDKIILYNFLHSFFTLFDAKMDNYKFNGKIVTGTIFWENEQEKQDFVWIPIIDDSSLLNVTQLCNFLGNQKLVNGDRITISESMLFSKLIDVGWNINAARKSIDTLSTLEIKMLDNGEETDPLFIHY